MGRQKAAFWVAVGGVSILSSFALELAARKFPQLGLTRFVSFVHAGSGKD